MADDPIRMEVKGLKETQKEMERIIKEMRGGPFTQALKKATLLVLRAGKKNLRGYRSPEVGGVDTGRLRASLTPEIRKMANEKIGVVGSNVLYSPYQEFGTRPFWPPLSALETWARRHGTTAYVVARAIARRGIKGKFYLQNALTDNAERIFQILGNAVGTIVEK